MLFLELNSLQIKIEGHIEVYMYVLMFLKLSFQLMLLHSIFQINHL